MATPEAPVVAEALQVPTVKSTVSPTRGSVPSVRVAESCTVWPTLPDTSSATRVVGLFGGRILMLSNTIW